MTDKERIEALERNNQKLEAQVEYLKGQSLEKALREFVEEVVSSMMSNI